MEKLTAAAAAFPLVIAGSPMMLPSIFEDKSLVL
jgi:hypothetical protein